MTTFEKNIFTKNLIFDLKDFIFHISITVKCISCRRVSKKCHRPTDIHTYRQSDSFLKKNKAAVSNSFVIFFC